MPDKNSRRRSRFQRPDWLRGARAGLAAGLTVIALASVVSPVVEAQGGAAGDAGDSPRLLPVGRRDFVAQEAPDPSLLPEGLSGITWLRGDTYLTVGDEHPCVHPLTIRIDPDSGGILSAEFGEPTVLTDSLGQPFPEDTMAKDREGIALGPTSESVWVANEWTGADTHRPSLELHSLKDGRMLRVVRTSSDSMLQVFSHIRYNLGFESLTKDPDGSGYWTANEGPLYVDDHRPNDSTGAVVRLQRFDAGMRALAQYAYRIDSYGKKISSPFFLAGSEAIGLSDLIALPGGRLLALERSLAGDASGAANFRHRIYLVDTKGATDVSRGALAAGLMGRTYVAATKRLLWELNSGFSNSNFEGMCLGPRLKDGDRVLLLVADNNQGRSEALYALRLAGVK